MVSGTTGCINLCPKSPLLSAAPDSLTRFIRQAPACVKMMNPSSDLMLPPKHRPRLDIRMNMKGILLRIPLWLMAGFLLTGATSKATPWSEVVKTPGELTYVIKITDLALTCPADDLAQMIDRTHELPAIRRSWTQAVIIDAWMDRAPKAEVWR